MYGGTKSCFAISSESEKGASMAIGSDVSTPDLVGWQTLSANHPSLSVEVSARLAQSFPQMPTYTRKEKVLRTSLRSHRANRSMHKSSSPVSSGNQESKRDSGA